jgi:hypothetical protein
MNIKKMLLTFALGWMVSFYTALVFETLWNWFAVQALHAPEIGYWTMYGLLILVRMVMGTDAAFQQLRFEKLTKLITACVPPEKSEEVQQDMKDEKKNLPWTWVGAIIGDALGITFAFGMGWVVHTFLA